MIEGVRGNGVHGDIALDDLLILDGENCQTVYGNGQLSISSHVS